MYVCIYDNTSVNQNNMKNLSFHNSVGFKMNKGFKNLCTGDTSTSTLNQKKSPDFLTEESPPLAGKQPTLEEMIMRLDLEEKMSTRAKLQEYGYGDVHVQHRMSCVNSSDILRSARNALNQYPRFSLDGKDAMYRSSFRNRASVVDRSRCLPAKVAGERVIWCKPGVVGRLMGLDAMPIPVRLNHRINSCILRNRNLRRRCLETQQIQTRKLDTNHHPPRPNTGYCVMKPVVAVEMARDEAGWPMRRFL